MNTTKQQVIQEVEAMVGMGIAPVSLPATIREGAFDGDIEDAKYDSISNIADLIIDLDKLRFTPWHLASKQNTTDAEL